MQELAESGRRILVSGSTGLIGRRVVGDRRAAGDAVVRLVRTGPEAPGTVVWNPAGELDPAALSGFDAVVHLAGEPVGNGRWTSAKKRRIRESRVEGTRKFATALAAAPQPPRVFVCASGINYYADGGDRVLDEATPRGDGFLSEVCVEWEAAANVLKPLSRVVPLRIGVVLSPEGGTLAMMLPLFRMGLGGVVGGGTQFVSWVTLADVSRVISHVIGSEHLADAVNVVSPEAVRGGEFAKALAKAVGKPALFPVPAWAAKLLMGQMAEETVLTSLRAVPRRLLEDGFSFQDPDLPAALANWNLSGAVTRPR